MKYKYGEIERDRIQGKSLGVGGQVIEVSFLALGKESSEMERAFKNGVCFWVGVVDEVSFWFDNWVCVSFWFDNWWVWVPCLGC